MNSSRINDIRNNLGDWRLFIRVADCGSFSEAARICSMDASTPSRRIARLEKTIGIKLFFRSTHTVQLTSQGIDIYKEVSQVLESFDSILDQKCAKFLSPQSSVIRVSMPACFIQYAFPHWMTTFQELYEDSRFELFLSDKALDPFASGIDIAFHTGSAVRSLKDADTHTVAQFEPVMIAAKRYLDLHGTPKTLDDLDHHILYNYGGSMGIGNTLRFIRDGAVVKKTFMPFVSAATSTAFIEPVLQGKGILLRGLPFVFNRYLKDKKVIKVLPDFKQPPCVVSIAVSKASLKRRLVSEFVTHVRDGCDLIDGFNPV